MKRHTIKARCKAVEIGNQLYTFEQIRPIFDKATSQLKDGGVRFKKYRGREWKLVTFATIAEGNQTTRDIEGWPVSFVISADGLEVRVKGEGGKRVISFGELANLGRRQPLLIK